MQSGKAQVLEVGGHAAEDQITIPTSFHACPPTVTQKKNMRLLEV